MSGLLLKKFYQLRRRMRKAHKTYLPIAFLFLFVHEAMAGADDFLRSTGKMYAVYAVIMIIFIGLIMYMLRLDKRIKEIEEKTNP